MSDSLHVGLDWRQVDAVNHPRFDVGPVALQGFFSFARKDRDQHLV